MLSPKINSVNILKYIPRAENSEKGRKREYNVKIN
jgi:hypothetical protein